MAQPQSPVSPVGECLPLRDYNMQYQLSPSPLTSQSPLTSPPPESACSSFQMYQSDTNASAILTWKNLKVSFRHKNNAHVVLEGITGYAEPCRLLNIMGPYKSGKSTLLRTISGRLTSKALLEGEILLNGRRQQLTYGTSAFITSEDIFPETLTVREHIYLSALMRLPRNMQYSEKVDRAEHVMKQMGLKEVASSYIGNGIGSGEKRRLSLALELLIDPCILYFDDPIRGLEHDAALHLVIKLKSLSRGGLTVITCIRQPCSVIFELVDDLCILSNGKMLYFGDSVSAVEHFSKIGFPCPPLYTPADYFVQVIGAEYDRLKASLQRSQDIETAEDSALEDNAQTVSILMTSFHNSETFTKVMARTNELAKRKGAVLVHSKKTPSLVVEFAALTYRSLLNMSRSSGLSWRRFCLSVFFMLAIGTLFLNTGYSLSSIQMRSSCIFIALECMIFLGLFGIPYHIHDVQLYIREKLNSRYGVITNVVADFVATLTLLFVLAVASSCSLYFIVGLHPGFTRLLYFILNLYVTLIVNEGLIKIVSILVPDVSSGMMVGATLQVLFMLVAGYLQHSNSIPKYIWKYPLSYASFHSYAIRGLFRNEFFGSVFGKGKTHARTGLYVIHQVYHMPQLGKWWDLLILGCMGVLYQIVFCMVLRLQEIRWRLRNVR